MDGKYGKPTGRGKTLKFNRFYISLRKAHVERRA
jgi:hypothetical protein